MSFWGLVFLCVFLGGMGWLVWKGVCGVGRESFWAWGGVVGVEGVCVVWVGSHFGLGVGWWWVGMDWGVWCG